MYICQLIEARQDVGNEGCTWDCYTASYPPFKIDALLPYCRETKEGWLLLIVETEKNWNSRSSYERGPFLAVSLGSSCRNKRFCPAVAALVGPYKINFFLTVHFFTLFVLIAQQAGQAVVPRCLSFSMCL